MILDQSSSRQAFFLLLFKKPYLEPDLASDSSALILVISFIRIEVLRTYAKLRWLEPALEYLSRGHGAEDSAIARRGEHNDASVYFA